MIDQIIAGALIAVGTGAVSAALTLSGMRATVQHLSERVARLESKVFPVS